MRMRITFKKGRDYDGRMRLPSSYLVNCNGKKIATIQCLDRGGGDSWFWYSHGINTAFTPKTLAECKVEVIAHFEAKAK